MEEKKVKKEKKKVDMGAILLMMFVTAGFCIFISWMYYGTKIDHIQKNNEVKMMMLQDTIEILNEKNGDLQSSLDKFNEDIQKALEENK